MLQSSRGQGQFGSSNVVAWVQEIQQNRPFKKIKLNGKTFKGLLYTGADKSCIAGKEWPSSWPVVKTSSSLQGLGLATNVAQSSIPLKWEEDGKQGYITPYIVTSLPFSLRGRDIMERFIVWKMART